MSPFLCISYPTLKGYLDCHVLLLLTVHSPSAGSCLLQINCSLASAAQVPATELRPNLSNLFEM